jgi:ribose-phosphate pyrophosphokinase
MNQLKIFTGNSNPVLAQRICKYLQLEPGQINIHTFSNENIKVKIQENVRESDVFVIQTASPPVNVHFMELLILIDALKYASAGRITAVMPYYFYVRSDKKDEPRISITARLVADLLKTAGATRILCLNLHSPQIMGFSRIPIDQLSAIDMICDYFKKSQDLSNFIAVAPDVGRARQTEAYAKLLKLPMAVIEKKRQGDKETAEVRRVIGDVNGKNVIMMDDEVLSGDTLIKGAKALKENGADKVFAACVHGYLSENAVENIKKSPIEQLVVTNTLPLAEYKKKSGVEELCVAKLIAQGIKAIHEGTPVSELYRI